MKTICDGCDRSVRTVGRLTKLTRRGLSQMLCKTCKRKQKMKMN